jgi:23S rRNA U2552 (ribose-2'-O)-methylase RlmE/FtsJ
MDPVVFPLPKDEGALAALRKGGLGPRFSRFHAQPALHLGFHHWIHQTKDNTAMFADPRYRKKYLVTNPFEHQVEGLEAGADIKASTERYLGLPKDGVISRAFYKLWELLVTYQLVPTKGPVTTLHIAEAPGAFVQATRLYRLKFHADAKRDKAFCVSLVPKGKGGIGFKEDVLRALKGVHICQEGDGVADGVENGDVTKPSVQRALGKATGEADLVTADGGFVWTNENYQEQEAYRLILGEIVTALRTQKKGGAFVLKIFETFTNTTVKLLMLLTAFYDSVVVHKPFTSRPSNSERYVVCMGFRGAAAKDIELLEQGLEKINDEEVHGAYLADILPGCEVPENITMAVRACATKIMNQQFVSINRGLTYLKNGIFFGDAYMRFLQEQKNANEFWVQTYLPTDKKAKPRLEQAIQRAVEETNALKKAIRA